MLVTTVLIFALFAPAVTQVSQMPDADEIMSRVAEHQANAQRAREKFTYTQRVRIRAIRSNGKLSREEYSVYNVVPTEKGTKKDLVEFKGRYEDGGHIAEYQTSGYEI